MRNRQLSQLYFTGLKHILVQWGEVQTVGQMVQKFQLERMQQHLCPTFLVWGREGVHCCAYESHPVTDAQVSTNDWHQALLAAMSQAAVCIKHVFNVDDFFCAPEYK